MGSKEKKARGWVTILYPESCDPDWEQKFSELGLQYVLSPLHDKDVNQGDGEIKKAHYHLLMLWDGPTTRSNAKWMSDLVGGVGLFQCLSIRGMLRYFCHLDNPDKFQYNIDEMHVCADVDVKSILRSDAEDELELSKMYKFIRQYEITSYADFVDFCCIYCEEWRHLINTKYRENIFRYIRGINYDKERGHKPLFDYPSTEESL